METVIRKLNKKEIKNLGNEFQFLMENDYSKMYFKRKSLIELRDKINNALGSDIDKNKQVYRELFYNFITWYNSKARIDKHKDCLVTTNVIEEYLKL